ncbi:MAG: DNA polymerase III subunit chi [Pseudomonadota bacterium]
MAEVRFYHLTERPLEAVLPVMLERSIQRGWRVVLRGTEPARIEALDAHLWSYRDESFLPHGRAGDGAEASQPILLTLDAEIPNDPNTLFLIDGAESAAEELSRMEMTAILFDGLDPAAVDRARAQWRLVTEAGLKAVYWAQEAGGWVKKVESG